MILNKIEIDVDLSDIDYEATPFVPGRKYLSNGDPGYPDEGGEIYVYHVWTKLKNRKGEEIDVDILPLLDEDEVVEGVGEDLADDYPDFDPDID